MSRPNPGSVDYTRLRGEGTMKVPAWMTVATRRPGLAQAEIQQTLAALAEGEASFAALVHSMLRYGIWFPDIEKYVRGVCARLEKPNDIDTHANGLSIHFMLFGQLESDRFSCMVEYWNYEATELLLNLPVTEPAGLEKLTTDLDADHLFFYLCALGKKPADPKDNVLSIPLHKVKELGYAATGTQIPIAELLHEVPAKELKQFAVVQLRDLTLGKKGMEELLPLLGRVEGVSELVEQALRKKKIKRANLIWVCGPDSVTDKQAYRAELRRWVHYCASMATIAIESLRPRPSLPLDERPHKSAHGCCAECEDLPESTAPHHPGCACGTIGPEEIAYGDDPELKVWKRYPR